MYCPYYTSDCYLIDNGREFSKENCINIFNSREDTSIFDNESLESDKFAFTLMSSLNEGIHDFSLYEDTCNLYIENNDYSRMISLPQYVLPDPDLDVHNASSSDPILVACVNDKLDRICSDPVCSPELPFASANPNPNPNPPPKARKRNSDSKRLPNFSKMQVTFLQSRRKFWKMKNPLLSIKTIAALVKREFFKKFPYLLSSFLNH